jgi:acetamidase/formamidase
VKTTLHEIPLERRTLHGHFSRDLEPVAEVRPGDVIRFATLDAGWGVEPPRTDGSERTRFSPLDPELDAGHALIGPVAMLGAVAGQTLVVGIEEVRVGSFGLTVAGGWSTLLNDRLGVGEGESKVLAWELDADAAVGRDRDGREVALAPFLGVLGMPPPEPGIHATGPPRASGGNLDCKELVAGTTLFLPIPVDGALFSAGDGHARQGDGEVSSTAIECPLERAQLSLSLRDDLELTAPIARTRDSWLAFGLGDDLDEAAANAVESMLVLMERRDALALASVVVDLRVTQVVNGVLGVHAVLRDDAIR